MARDTSLPLRQAIVTTLKADDALVALVPEDSIYGMRTPSQPTWPFTRYGAPDAVPFLAQCLDGARVRFAIHGFSKTAYEDEVAEITAAAAAALDGKVFELDADFDATAHIRWIGSQILADTAEANAWHGIASFEATISS